MTAPDDVGYHARQHARWRVSEVAFWVLVLACALAVSLALSDHDRHPAAGAVRAVARPDPRLCRHRLARPRRLLRRRRLFGGTAGAARHHQRAGALRWWSPASSPMVLGFFTSFLVIRGVDLTRLMVTLGIALLLEALGERFSNITGGTDGLQGIEMQPILGLFAFDMFGKIGFFYCLDRAVPAVPAGAADRAFAVRPVAARDPQQSAAGGRDRHPRQPAPDRGLHAVGVLCRHRRRAVHPDHGAGLARRVLVRTLGRSDAGAGDRRHRLSLWRADRRGRVQDAAGGVSRPSRRNTGSSGSASCWS